MATMPGIPGGTWTAGTLGPRPSLEVIGPDDAGQVRGIQLGQLLEQVQRVQEDPHHVVQRIEVVDPDEPRGFRRVVVEVLVPRPMVDDDQIAGLPLVALAVDLAVAAARDDVEPGLAAVAVARRGEARRPPRPDPRPARRVVDRPRG